MAMAETCPPPPEPVLTLDYGSRYTDDSETRSEIDDAAEAELEASLQPLDDFIRVLAELANQVYLADAPRAEIAECVTRQIAVWARAQALQDLASSTARLTIGSRIAGFGMVLRQVTPHGGAPEDLVVIQDWLSALAHAQMTFWEEDAPPGAKRGNLRAWAALGAAATADLTDDGILRSWAAWSMDYVLCSAAPDGSLPQEMSRGRLAYHYQLHAVAPLVVTTRLLRDHGLYPGARCGDALTRVVAFTLADMSDGARTREITGEDQRYFDGEDSLSGYNLAWLPAWQTLAPDPELAQLAADFQPLSSSKLGGDQSLIWRSEPY